MHSWNSSIITHSQNWAVKVSLFLKNFFYFLVFQSKRKTPSINAEERERNKGCQEKWNIPKCRIIDSVFLRMSCCYWHSWKMFHLRGKNVASSEGSAQTSNCGFIRKLLHIVHVVFFESVESLKSIFLSGWFLGGFRITLE